MDNIVAERNAYLALSQDWRQRFAQLTPDISDRVRIRLAWRLAAENIATDDELSALTADAMLRWPEVGLKCVELRDHYIRRRLLRGR
jgi:hypothetical protein